MQIKNDSSSETMDTKGQWKNIFKVLKEKHVPLEFCVQQNFFQK